MKKTIVNTIALTTLALTLAGCQPLNDLTDKVKEEVEQKKAGSVKPMSESEYEVAVSEKSKKFYDTLGETLLKLSETKVVDSEMLDWLYSQTAEMEALAKEVTNLEPPASYQEVDQVYEEAMKEFGIYLKGFKNALDAKDISLAMDYYDNSVKGEQLLNRANALLSLTYDRPVGDGSITSKDLKDLDKNAGIDRDSVLLNLSEEGDELAGTWGFYNEDGSFNVSIVLESNGDYSGYGNGKYPNDPLTGTWKYDYLKHVIVFEHDNGGRPEMTMDVQSFQSDSMQLMDVDTLATFQYVKEGSPNPEAKSTTPSTKPSSSSPSNNSTKQSNKVGESELYGMWSLMNEKQEYQGLTFSNDHYGNYNFNDYKSINNTYYGNWTYDESNGLIVLDVEDTDNTDNQSVKDAPSSLTFEIVSLKGEVLQVKQDGKVYEYKRVF